MDDLDARLRALKKRLSRAQLPAEQQLRKPLSAARLRAVEKKLGLALPVEYREFLRQVGDGGPAPDGVLLPLEHALEVAPVRGDLPFPLSEPAGDEFLELDDNLGGAMVISDGGDAQHTVLVLSGPLAGRVWFSGDPGWRPHRLGFLDWYERGLDLPAGAAKRRPAKKAVAAPVLPKLDAVQVNLRDRGLESLPDEIGSLTAVTMMYLGRNRIRALPESFANLGRTLLALELGPNPIAELPESIFARLPLLTTLDLTGIEVRRLPEALTAMPRLWQLQLAENPNLDLKQALGICARVPSLRWLSIGHARLAKIPEEVFALTGLERLYLNDCALTELPEGLATLKLELLAVKNNGIQEIPDALEPRVKNLYFGGNPGARAEKKRWSAIRKNFVLLD